MRSVKVRHREKGMAMLLVLISVSVAVTLGMSFLNAQVTSAGLTDNVVRRAQAQAIAESGLSMALAYIDTDVNWRTNMSHGLWVGSEAFGGGTFTIYGEDGEDIDGDDIPDGDSDLADDPNDPMTLTVTGTISGLSHTIQTVVNPAGPKKRLLLIVPDPNSLAPEDKARRAQFETWDYVVTLLGENDSQSVCDAAVANAEVAYISENVYSYNLNTKLTNTTIGIVCEETNLIDDFKLSNTQGSYYSGYTQINVTDNTHFITSPLSTGLQAIVNSSSEGLRSISGTLAPGMTVLATRSSSSVPVMAVIESGGTLTDSTPAAGRRVILPLAGDTFSWSSLTPAGLTLVERSLEWASQPMLPGQIAYWNLDETSGTVAGDSVGNSNGVYRNGVSLNQSGAMTNSKAVQFDGVNDHVEVPHNNAFLLDQGTFVLWFKTFNTTTRQGLISKDSAGFDTGGHLSIFIHEGNHIEVRLQSVTIGGGASYTIKSAHNVLQNNTWYHIAFTFGPDGMKLYHDGTQVDADGYTGGMGTNSGGVGNYEPMAFGVMTMNTDDLTLSGWNYPLKGWIDEVYTFNRQLTQSEVQSLMSGPGAPAGMAYDVRWVSQP